MHKLPGVYLDYDLFDLGALPDASEDFVGFLFNIREKFGLDDVAYAGMNPINGSVFGHVTYGDAWKMHYVEHGFHRIDPTLQKARRSIAPVDWSRLERDQDFRRVFDDARDFGIHDQGLTIPVRGPYGDIGGLSVTSSLSRTEWNKLKSDVIVGLQSVAVHVHDMVIRSDSLSNLLKTPNLSQREIEVLQWISAGKSQQDIADILTISNRTVEVHLRSARHKLYALTTAQAVGRAISMGLIYPG
ncbi:transcriptional regulator, LuxR family [Roseovarius azorensis]|uniref:Transcriptional regulator, LuxR family n=1 Tax=Roseovarius azorensis TaxID=1287727 RepID=A0A1H7LQC4_9RHOB|nr:autoinducer binding domain-containing protein [Roseovarius azorensis]SEL00918.1 transcriptional regulator, LuxR family [Roseovarius azorensis]